MEVPRAIYLIGPRACGKTSVGRALADRLGLDFVDTDHELARDVGMEIADYVAARGWDAFRDREAGVLARLAAGPLRVVGCGGGIVLRAENRSVLSGGVVVYLRTEPETLAARLMRDPNEAQRPSLTGKGIVDEVREVLAERAPLYEACADIVLAEAPLAEVVGAALDALKPFSMHF
ncbi:shikimate kinase AroL [Pseudodesulfovibrio sp.]|uniref:shikimate kinase AroL n=1 Tax=Pseudodesulfovibrio sp. TaxID=2035812 RepID=UPI0026140C28|nr:shikimate kinase AroL [Pseudodesulfovibrio sp.]MDD3312489.1 shikimate kinase AroL [Pseudodesulfovibrio sp.]